MVLAVIGAVLLLLGAVAVLTGVLPVDALLILVDRVGPILLFVITMTVVTESPPTPAHAVTRRPMRRIQGEFHRAGTYPVSQQFSLAPASPQSPSVFGRTGANVTIGPLRTADRYVHDRNRTRSTHRGRQRRWHPV